MARHLFQITRKLLPPSILFLAATIVVGRPESSMAQQYGNSFGSNNLRQLTRPTTSPYLNLVQPGLDPAITYQQMVRPQRLFRRNITAQNLAITDLERTVHQPSLTGETQTTRVKQTGHPTAFMSMGTYFPALGSTSQRSPRQLPARGKR